jgi:hypothetical protein
MELDQRQAIKFFLEEGMKGTEISDRLNEHYGQGPSEKASVLLDQAGQIGQKVSFKRHAIEKGAR